MKKIFILSMFICMTIAVTGCKKQTDMETDSTSSYTAETKTTVTKTPNVELTPTVKPKQEVNLYPAYENVNGVKKYGYIDRTGAFVIDPQYESVNDFSDETALVSDENGSKYIDATGNVIYRVSDDITLSSPSVNGATVFQKTVNNAIKYGYLDTHGNVLLEPIYDRADDFKEDGTAYVIVNGKYEKINKSGDILDSYNVSSRYSNIIDFKDGYIIYEDPDTQSEGVIDYKENVILTPPDNSDISPNNNSIIYLGEGLFGVGDNSKSYYFTGNRPYAIFGNKGEQLTDYKYYDLSAFHDGYASVTDDKYTYFITTNGETDTNLPKLAGRGTLTLMGNIIKAEIDGNLMYLNKDGKVFWQGALSQKLDNVLTIGSVKVKPNKFITIYYPVLSGLQSKDLQDKINHKLKKLFLDPRKDLTKEDGLSVEDTFQSELLGNILVINRQGYDYNFGAAHGMPFKDTYHIDLSTGKMYSLKDLFYDNADYVDAISKIIGQKITEAKKSDNTMYFDDFSKISENQSFHLTKDGIIIYFSPYEIAPYSTGMPEFLIPYYKLDKIIHYSGELWQAHKSR